MVADGTQHRRVRVRVGDAGVSAPRPAATPLVFLSIGPPGTLPLSRAYPRAKVAGTRGDTDGADHVRLPRGADVSGVPGLDAPVPTRLRDALTLAFAAGAPSVDIVHASAVGLLPWELDDPRFLSIADPFLHQMPEAVVVFPDAGGPPSIRGETGGAREWALVRRVLAAHAAGLRERYQLALVDAPDDLDSADAHPLEADAALCRMVGAGDAWRRHGWRAACAIVGATLAGPGTSPVRGVVGQRIPLGMGRVCAATRHAELGLADTRGGSPPGGALGSVEVRIDADGEAARIATEPTLREPIGEWSIPATRTVKALHNALMQAASAFVFRNVDVAQGMGLVLAVQQAMRPFVDAGVLLGPTGNGPPRVSGDIDKNPTHPGLIADVSGQIRPWCHAVDLRVAVRAAGAAIEGAR